MQIGVAEFLEKAAKLKRKEQRVRALQANDSFVLKTTLQAAFDPRIKFLLPSGPVPFKPNPLPDQESNYINMCRKLVYFVEGPHSGLNPVRRQQMFIEFLEAIDKNDAAMLIEIKDKKFPFKGIDAAIVREAFPSLLPEE